MLAFFNNLFELSLDIAMWLLLGLTIAGVLRTILPTKWVQRVLGKSRFFGPIWAAILGTPLPLCSCSVIPVAVGIRRQGASDASTVSFLVATPQNGPDTFLVTWAMLGPVMAIIRPIIGIVSAVLVAIPVSFVSTKPLFKEDREAQAQADAAREAEGSCCGPKPATSCCASKPAKSCCDEQPKTSGCCSSGGSGEKKSFFLRLIADIHYAYTKIFSDLALWLCIGIAIAALVKTLVSPDLLESWGGHPVTMFVMLIIGIPMYICSTSSTPIAAALYMAGISPGAIVVFLLAGPTTNSSTFGILYKEMGIRATVVFAASMMFISLAIGFLVDVLFSMTDYTLNPQHLHKHEMTLAVAYFCLTALFAMGVYNAYRKLKSIAKNPHLH